MLFKGSRKDCYRKAQQTLGLEISGHLALRSAVTKFAGEFAETVREQFLAERVEYFKDLQRLLYVEASNEDSASKQMLVRALCKCDPELGEKQVNQLSGCGMQDPCYNAEGGPLWGH